MEKEHVTKQAQLLDSKLNETQEIVLQKMKDLGVAKSENLPLKAEVEGLRALIDEEKERYIIFTYSATASVRKLFGSLINEVTTHSDVSKLSNLLSAGSY